VTANPTTLGSTTSTTAVPRSLDTAGFIAVTTFRRSGDAVSTPVLFVLDGDRILVRTAQDSGKVKRIAANPAVLVAPSDARGRPTGEAVAGTARILGPEATSPVLASLRQKHSIAVPLFSAIRRLRGQEDVILAITLADR